MSQQQQHQPRQHESQQHQPRYQRQQQPQQQHESQQQYQPQQQQQYQPQQQQYQPQYQQQQQPQQQHESQQQYQPQQQQQYQPQQSQSTYGQSQQVGGGVGQRQQDRQAIWQSVMTLNRFETALEIAEVQALESGRVRIARLCGDLVAITEAEKKLVLRRSPFAEPIGQAVKQTIQQAVQELQQAADIPEVQQALTEAQQATSAIDRAQSLVQAREAAMAGGYQPMYGPSQQFGGGMGQQQFQQQVQQVGQDVRQTATTLHRFETALELARMKALESGRVRVARVAGDLAIVAHLEKKLVLRRSPFAEPIGRAVQQTIQQGLEELQQATDIPDVQAALSEAQPAIEAVRTAVSGQFGQQMQGQFGQTGQVGAGVGQSQFGQGFGQTGQVGAGVGQSQFGQTGQVGQTTGMQGHGGQAQQY